MSYSLKLSFYYAPWLAPGSATSFLVAAFAASVAAWKLAVVAAAVAAALLLLGWFLVSAHADVMVRWRYLGVFIFWFGWQSLIPPMIMAVEQNWVVEGWLWMGVGLGGILLGRFFMKRGLHASTAA